MELGKVPYRLSVGASGFRLEDHHPQGAFGGALHRMQTLLIHGISDERECQDCLYVIFSSNDHFSDSTLDVLENLLPYLDTALRRLPPMPRGAHSASSSDDALKENENRELSVREIEVMKWVRLGKTNPEIASLLGISIYTVKNHLRHIFKKLDVYNRIQAVSKVEPSLSLS